MVYFKLFFTSGVLVLLAKPLGVFMARVFEAKQNISHPIFGPVEKFIYRVSGINPDEEMDWKENAIAMMLFNFVGIDHRLWISTASTISSVEPQGLGAVSPDSSFNTAVSFATNTNWQGYGGETTMSYFTQMVGLTVQNFVSAATGMAVLALFIRGLLVIRLKHSGIFGSI